MAEKFADKYPYLSAYKDFYIHIATESKLKNMDIVYKLNDKNIDESIKELDMQVVDEGPVMLHKTLTTNFGNNSLREFNDVRVVE